LAFILVLLLIWGAGLFAFASRIVASTPAPEPAHADGIVALTGSSSVRIEAAVQLLEDGKAARLLVSVAHDFGRAFNCCVDLGFRAANTQGNAQETANWAAYHGYRSLIVVTADYHMPRAILELQAAMPRVALHPYPVVTSTVDARRWWRNQGDARRLVVEYCKYLVILGREGVLRLGGKRESLVAPGETDTRPVGANAG
jgi:uncharacterized SAM-binding protein YcdF (DUF218 family)